MPELSYRKSGLVLEHGGGDASDRQIRDLQRDLRRLGYLKRGIDGAFGNGTQRAVKALQHDLLNNGGASTNGDGPAPVGVRGYKKDRVVEVTGVADQDLVECIADMLDDDAFPKLPSVRDPVAENDAIGVRLAALTAIAVPAPYLVAVLRQESDLKHFNEPRPGDEDTYIVVGLDAKAEAPHVITSRGYGVGQYTLFHHPPRRDEVDDFMLDPAKNITKSVAELKEKFDRFVNGATSGTRADDRLAEFGPGPLRVCKFDRDDPKHMRDCKQCLREAGSHDIEDGITPFFEGSAHTYRPTQFHDPASYTGVPVRKNIDCDWPYAVRRYNGSGVNSYHYQTKVLLRLLNG